MVSDLQIRRFKRIEETSIPLSPFTVLVGGNNSGKTTVLQAAHFGVSLLQTSVLFGPRFGSASLLYAPTEDVLDVAHGERLGETPVEITYHIGDGEVRESLKVRLTASADAAAIVESDGSDAVFRRLSDVENVFSIYVPGLAGIPVREEYRSNAVVKSGIARGDANLFLRNVLLRIRSDEERWRELQDLVDAVFPGTAIKVTFNPDRDITIDARIVTNDVDLPLDMAGTGVLQFLQIAAYTVNYKPALLLLDEPDAHLHPNNQRLIAQTLLTIAEGGTTRVVIATHSRTILDALEDEELASFLWLEHGVVQQEKNKERLSMLLALGALDGAERMYQGDYRVVIFTEDTDKKKRHLKTTLEANGFEARDVLIRSYQGSSEFQAAALLTKFIKDIRPGVEVIVHRDRDFMTKDEIEVLEDRYVKKGVTLFVTNGSDIEASFATAEHIAACTNITAERAQAVIDEVVQERAAVVSMRFAHKRGEVKNLIYPGRQNECPSTEKMLRDGAVRPEHAIGKDLIGWVIGALEEKRLARGRDLMKPSVALEHPALREVATRVYGAADQLGAAPGVGDSEAVAGEGRANGRD